MLIIVDRFEGDYAVLLEENQTRDVPKQALAADIREGDVVFPDTDGIWKKDTAATEKRKSQIAKKMDALWEISSRTRFLYKNLHNFLPVCTNVFQYG